MEKECTRNTKERGESDAAPRKNASLNCFGALQPLFTPSLPAYLPPAHSSTLQREQAKKEQAKNCLLSRSIRRQLSVSEREWRRRHCRCCPPSLTHTTGKPVLLLLVLLLVLLLPKFRLATVASGRCDRGRNESDNYAPAEPRIYDRPTDGATTTTAAPGAGKHTQTLTN